jgi:uncharacterized protein
VRYVIIDTGPLAALLNHHDRHHGWIRAVLGDIEPPLLTCESVISEACFLLRGLDGGHDAVLALLARDVIRLDFQLAGEAEAVRALMAKYADVPMSLADACLVRMSEHRPHCVVISLDQDFRIYRRNGRRVIPIMTPES